MCFLGTSGIERLAEREWSKLARSKDRLALDRFHLLFSGAPQAQLAQVRIARLASSPNTAGRSPHNDLGQNWFAAFINRHPVASAFLWLLITLPLGVLLGFLFENKKWAYLTIIPSSEYINYVLNGLCFGILLICPTAILNMSFRWSSFVLLEGAIYLFGCAGYLGFVVCVLWIHGHGPVLIGGNEQITAFAIWALILAAPGIVAYAWRKGRQRRGA